MTSKSIDWAAVEQDYRAGIKTLRQIAEAQGLTHGAINKRAKRDGWSRDLNAKILAKADDLVSKAAVSSAVSKAQAASERQVIEANGQALAAVIRGHREDLGRLRGVVSSLLEKVEAILAESALFRQIGALCASPDENGIDKINELYRKVIELPAQTETTKRLAETLKILIELERKVFRLDAADDPVEAAARGAAQGAALGMSAATSSILAALEEDLAAEDQAAA